MNEKAKLELSPRDQRALTELLAKDDLTPMELESLSARKDYLSEETCKRLGLSATKKKATKKAPKKTK